MKTFRFDALWRPKGWLEPAYVSVTAQGDVSAVSAQAHDGQVVEESGGLALPGIANLHSHAFQRAMVGRAERASGHADSFWTWREAMYRSVDRIEPEHLEAIAAWLYVEMLEAGYTSVGEFHYLHHDKDGRPYDNRAELALRVLRAAATAGIGITMLPVLYAKSGFDGRDATAAQRRFVNTVDGLLEITDAIRKAAGGDANVAVGVAPHSLRAVSIHMLRDLVQGLPAEAPVHIHIAEQQREVQECVSATGVSPIERLTAEVPVDARWCLVHATHATDSELSKISQAGATVGLCPTTEANLGDGMPPVRGLIDKAIPFGIGSDSQVCVSPAEELRLLEYEQRLLNERRNVLASAEHPSVAARLLAEVGGSASRVMGRSVGGLEPEARADLVVLDPNAPALVGLSRDQQLDAWVFGARGSCVRDVMVGGKWVVQRGKHPKREALFEGYIRALDEIV